MAAVVYNNLADAATVLASSQVVLAPAVNVQNEHVARKWRSITAADHLIADFGSLVSIDTVAAIGLTAATMRVRLSTVDSSGAAGDAYDGGTDAVDQNYRAGIELLPSAVSARYLRVDFASGGSYCEVGRLVAGVRSRFTYNFAYGWGRSWIDPSIRTKTRGGQTQISPETSYRTLDLNFEWLATADRHGFVEAIDRDNGLKTDVLFITDEDSASLARDSLWGLVAEMTPVSQPYFGMFTKQLRIEERL
jgi:hypothetical protein